MTIHGAVHPQIYERVIDDGPARLGDDLGAVPRRRGALANLMLALLGLGLAYLVIANTLVAYLADASPERALSISPRDPIALISATERTFNRPKPADNPAADSTVTSARSAPIRIPRAPVLGIDAELEAAEVAQLRSRVEAALAAEPMSARATRILGQLAEWDGDTRRATTLLEAAVRRSKHDSLAVLMMIRRSADTQNWPAAMFYADVLMRSRHDLLQAVTPLVVRLAETPAANPLVKKALAEKPVWRGVFFQLMLGSLTDARTPLDLYLSLKDTDSPPTREEISAYLRFLIGNQLHELAYYTWLQFLPPELMAAAGFVFNGNFDMPPSGMPFDWTLPGSVEATVEIARVPGEDANRALRIEFGSGRVQLGNIQQRTLLAPGSYKLAGRHKGEIAGRRGTRVTIMCADRSNAKLAEGPMLIGQLLDWRKFEVTFTVPDDCQSQLVRIHLDARYSAEQFLTGLVWYDDISISRADN